MAAVSCVKSLEATPSGCVFNCYDLYGMKSSLKYFSARVNLNTHTCNVSCLQNNTTRL